MNTTPTFFFTADEHYGHTNIIKYCDRPFASVEEMDAEIIKRHNDLVGPQDALNRRHCAAIGNTLFLKYPV